MNQLEVVDRVQGIRVRHQAVAVFLTARTRATIEEAL